MRILHPYLTLLDTQHAPGSVSQLKHVPLQTLNGEVLIYRTDHELAGFEYDRIIRCVRDGPAGRDCRDAGVAAPAYSMIDRIMMEVSRATPALGGKSLSEHAYH